MTDEELAEEKIDKMADDFVNAQEFTKVYGIARKAECGAFWKYGFLAGLKAGRPQWHDLRKDPNDLPKEFDINKNRWEMEKRITKHIVQNECGERVFCFNGTWYHEKGGEAHPIAWCEIPTFDKESE